MIDRQLARGGIAPICGECVALRKAPPPVVERPIKMPRVERKPPKTPRLGASPPSCSFSEADPYEDRGDLRRCNSELD